MRIHWATEYGNAIGNSLGYSVMNDRSRDAAVDAGAVLDESADVAISVAPPHRFKPVPGKKNLLFCCWEAPELPEQFRVTVPQADLICVSATFLKEPFEQFGRPVSVVPLGVDFERFAYVDRDTPAKRPCRARARLNPFRFLWVGAPNVRKGPMHVIEAWRGLSEGPLGDELLTTAELYIKTTCHEGAKSRVGIFRKGNVLVDDRLLSVAELQKLYASAHAFVFPSIGEGFGLTMAEAMATGLCPIYTPWSALTDLAPLGSDVGLPIKFSVQTANWRFDPIPGEHGEFAVDVSVAAADTVDLCAKMLHAVAHWPEIYSRGRRAAAFIRSFTWRRTGEMLLSAAKEMSNG